MPLLANSCVALLEFLLTEEGKKFYREKEGLGLVGKKEVRGDICFGQRALDKIVKSEEPIVVGDKKELALYYTYKIENLAEWVKNPDIQRAFPGIVPTINGAGKTILNQALTLTNRDGKLRDWMARLRTTSISAEAIR